MNLTDWAHARGSHVRTAYRWYREGELPVPAQKVACLTAWAAQAGQLVVRVGAGVGSGVNGARAGTGLLLAGPAATVVVVEHRDRLGRVNTELAGAALSGIGPRAALEAGGVPCGGGR